MHLISSADIQMQMQWQTVKTQIRLLLSDLCLPCLPSRRAGQHLKFLPRPLSVFSVSVK